MTARLRLDRPGPVMTDPTHKLHPTEPRFLTWYEWLAMTGMPNDWIPGPRSIQQAGVELSRAVLRPVGRWLATAVLRGLKKPPLRGAVTTRLVDLTDPERPYEQELFKFEGLTIKPIVPPPLPPLNAPKAPKPPKPCEACGGDAKRAKKCKVCMGTGFKPRPPPRDPSKPGSGARIREMLMKGMDADSILAVIHKEFPGSRASKSDVSWNRGKLRKLGQVIPGETVPRLGRPVGKVKGEKTPAAFIPPNAKPITFGKAVAR
jgi:hypothetical protein